MDVASTYHRWTCRSGVASVDYSPNYINPEAVPNLGLKTFSVNELNFYSLGCRCSTHALEVYVEADSIEASVPVPASRPSLVVNHLIFDAYIVFDLFLDEERWLAFL